MKIGLKLWSINTDMINEAIKLYEQNYFDYIELYIVPDSYDTITLWKKVSIPFIIHFPHIVHKVNLADKFKRKQNMLVYKNIKIFADMLKVPYIIFHGGIEGNTDELIYQIKMIHDERMIIENKPFMVIFKKTLEKKFCRGATLEEIDYVLQNTSCVFCLDISHAICSAITQHIDPYFYISQFNAFSPVMYHISDMDDINSSFDSHSHLGKGQIDFDKVFKNINSNAMITIETAQLTRTNQNNFINDVNFIQTYYKNN